MVKKTDSQTTMALHPTQTPFERFKAAASQVLTFQKSSLPKPTKKSVKKK
jgi:hypothetical protein